MAGRPALSVRTGAWLTAARLALAALVVALACGRLQADDVPTVVAAADLKFALEEIAADFRRERQRDVRLTFGSSGNLARQIAQGAPFQLFLSADEDFVFRLADEGRTLDRGALYAIGRIVLFAPEGSPLKPDPQMRGLRTALAEGRIRRFAIANPEHAPYGRAAEAALRRLELWDAVQPALVLGENAAQAMQFASSGSAQGGIVPYSLSLAPAIQPLGTFALLPEDLHPPLRQRMVLLQGAGETAKAFYADLQQPAARSVFRRYGFVLPGEQN